MANFKQKFGSDRVTRSDNQTPQQKKSDPNPRTTATADTTTSSEQAKNTKRPSGVSDELWAEAEASALGLNGGFSGVDKAGRERQIREQYDKMVESDKQTKEWAAGSGILGDIGEK